MERERVGGDVALLSPYNLTNWINLILVRASSTFAQRSLYFYVYSTAAAASPVQSLSIK